MRRLIEIISRNGVSAGPGQKAVLHLPITEATSTVFNTLFKTDDCLSVETDGYSVSVTIYGNDGVLQETLDKNVMSKLLEYLFFGGISAAVTLTQTIKKQFS